MGRPESGHRANSGKRCDATDRRKGFAGNRSSAGGNEVRTMKVRCSFLAIAAFFLSSAAASAQMIPENVGPSSNGLPPALANVGFDPQFNVQIAMDEAV